MPFSIQDILFGGVVPALIGLALTMALAQLPKRIPWLTLGCPVGMVAGIWAGYWLLNLGPLLPEHDRDWIPVAVTLALVPSFLTGCTRLALFVQSLAVVVVVVASSWLLVPTWESLEPSRLIYMVGWSAYVIVLAVGLILLARREIDFTKAPSSETSLEHAPPSCLFFLGLMLLALAASAVLLVMSGSLRFAQIALAGLAALLGVAIGLLFTGRRPALHGLAIAYAMLISSVLLTGQLNSFSDIPWASYLLLPTLALAFGAIPPVRDSVGEQAQMPTIRRFVLPACLAIIIGAIALGMAVVAEYGPEAAAKSTFADPTRDS